MLNKIIPAILFCLAFALGAQAQTSNVTATVTDADSQTWNNATYTISFVQPPNNATAPVWNGTPMTPSQKLYTGSLNGSGVLTVALPDNAFITPAGSLWLFVICPNASAQCTQVSLKVTGASPDLSTLISSATITPRFSALLNAYGYLDVEVTPTPVPGGSYFNVTNGVTRIWTGWAWVNQGSGAGGGTVTSVSGTANQISVATGTTTPVISLSSTISLPGTLTQSTAGAASTSPILLNGTIFTGGSGTTTFPYAYLNFGNAPSTWSTSGTLLGFNAPSGFTGNILDGHVNGGTSVFSINQAGSYSTSGGNIATTNGTVTGAKYNTATNCSAAGTAASPSVVSCSSASSGAFSCATNASGATCQVNTTAVSTNSDIQITPTASAGARLGVTCNTTADIPTGPRIASISNGASFTINLGTVATNPTCYFYTITN